MEGGRDSMIPPPPSLQTLQREITELEEAVQEAHALQVSTEARLLETVR